MDNLIIQLFLVSVIFFPTIILLNVILNNIQINLCNPNQYQN